MRQVSGSKKRVALLHLQAKAVSATAAAAPRVAAPETIRRTTVAKVSHTLTVALVERLE